MIRNIIFDIGNVFVRWAPTEVVQRCYDLPAGSAENLAKAAHLFRGHGLWLDLNRGTLNMEQVRRAYREKVGLSEDEVERFFFHALDHQVMVEGTEELATHLKAKGYHLFALTDNVHEFVEHHKAHRTFWNLFEDAVVSDEVKLLKPDPAIFSLAVEKFGIAAPETVFFDDVLANVEGAKSVGMEARVFTTAAHCAEDLRTLGVQF